jgi:hypothetical protein
MTPNTAGTQAYEPPAITELGELHELTSLKTGRPSDGMAALGSA